jgi:hypothetical protein
MRSFNRTLARLSVVVLAAVVFAAVGLSALALAVKIIAVFGSPAAYAQNVGDIPANRALDANCAGSDNLGPMATAWCTDKSGLILKSEVTVDPSGHLPLAGA